MIKSDRVHLRSITSRNPPERTKKFSQFRYHSKKRTPKRESVEIFEGLIHRRIFLEYQLGCLGSNFQLNSNLNLSSLSSSCYWIKIRVCNIAERSSDDSPDVLLCQPTSPINYRKFRKETTTPFPSKFCTFTHDTSLLKMGQIMLWRSVSPDFHQLSFNQLSSTNYCATNLKINSNSNCRGQRQHWSAEFIR